MSIFSRILLTGSMVFGKHYSVTDISDIDLIFVLDAGKISKLKENGLFSQMDISDDLIEAFATGWIDRFGLNHMVEDINLNIGLCSKKFLEDFMALQAYVHRLGTLDSEVEAIRTVDVTGKLFTYTPELQRYKSIYIKQFILKLRGVPIGSPTYSSLVASEAIYDTDHDWEEKMEVFIAKLNADFGSDWFKNFLSHILRKGSPDYLAKLSLLLQTDI